MSTFTRKNAWNNDGTFDNPDLLWYAKGVGAMQSLSLDNLNSWWFFAAIHGEYLSGSSFPGWGHIPGPPNVPTTPVPTPKIQDKYWNQCQHQSWYFTPWHRGYLIALEAQIRSAVVALGGPKDWALPYWNYFGPDNEYKIPPAFTELTLPDGSSNPLFVHARYGPKNNGDIYIPPASVSQDCQRNTIFTGSNPSTKLPGYGGPSTGFWHSGGTSGNLESNPHNKVHTLVGGNQGIMSYPDTAALDPIFYLHHCNIDRMWASWNNAGNGNPTVKNWLSGPAAAGEREFIMPLPTLSAWVYTPADVNSLSQLDYDYEDLSTGVAPLLVSKLSQRLSKLGVASANVEKEENMDLGANSELVGANRGALEIKNSGARTTVHFDQATWKKVPGSLFMASEAALPDRVYLQLENVRGAMDANMLTVSVNQKRVGDISLFGLRTASADDGHHGGGGLTFLLDITDVIDDLHLDNALDADAMDIMIVPSNEIPDSEKITVDRVSVYREGQM